MSIGRIESDDVKRAASGRWREIYSSITGVDFRSMNGKHQPCPKCGGKDRFRLFADFDETGGLICGQCAPEVRDGIAGVKWWLNCEFEAALKRVAELVGVTAVKSNVVQGGSVDTLPGWWDDYVARVCSIKGMPIPSAYAYGLHCSDREKARGMSFPMYGPDGKQCSSYQLSETDGRNEKGKSAGLFLPHLDGKVRIPQRGEIWLMVEGVKDAAALHGLGYLAVGLPTSSMNKKFAQLFDGVNTMIIPDLDTSGATGANKSAANLSRAAASVVLATLPGETRNKKGIDVRDVLALPDGESQVRYAIETAKPTADLREDCESGGTGNEAKDMDPAAEADLLVLSMMTDGVCRLRFWNGQWWYFMNGCYSLRRDDEVRAELVNRLNKSYSMVRPRHVNDVIEHLRAKTILASTVQAPAWLAGNGDDPSPDECVALRNSVLHLPSLFNVDKYLVPATPRLLTTAACDYEFDVEAPEPVEWFKFLDSVWGDDRESVDTLQEILGYLLTPDTRQHKIFLLVGPTRSGKGAISRVLRKMIGTANVCGPTLAGLAGNFGLQPLLGKSVAVISDARLGGRTDASIVLERLLSISGEDALTVDVKHKEPITTKLPTRLVILSNELPRLADASSAITGRFLVLRMTQSFLGREDRQLDDKLAAELPSIFLWSCEGWLRLNERGYFRQPESSLELLGDLRDLASPITAFVRERCEVGPGLSVPVSELFREWSDWCRSQGRDHTGIVQVFGRDLLAAIPGVSSRQRRELGKVIRFYEGIKTSSGY